MTSPVTPEIIRQRFGAAALMCLVFVRVQKMYLMDRLEASVIVRDMCLADSAISARKDSTIYSSQTLMAAAPVTAIPLGQSMEILPVTKIQASASAKKMLLVGLRCDHCNFGYKFRHNVNKAGCEPCQCHIHGSVNEFCNPSTGFYVSPHSINGCLPCSCHTTGSVNEVCDNLTGQCICQDDSVAGMRCDHCGPLYYGFDSETGKCQRCNCHPAGAINGTCHPITGQCVCKQFVTGSKCDNCVPGAGNLDAHNLFGCSKIPSQQPPPEGRVLNSSAIRLTWNPPDSPNSNRLTYQLYRDASGIYTTEDHYPYSTQVFTDTFLYPYTSYSYHLEASNVRGSTSSSTLTYRTQPGVPVGNLHLNPILPVGPHSISFNWTALSNNSGPIVKYILRCASTVGLQPCGQHEGLETFATIWNLVPFTRYSFYLQACTSGGCLLSQQVAVITAQAPPEEQQPPAVQSISSTELAVEWEHPKKPNASGWFNPHPVLESANENALRPPLTSTRVTDLDPYTKYEFRVLAVNMAGSTFSNWTSQRTSEAAPVFMPPPSVFPLSPYSLSVSWEKPQDNEARGEVMGYSVNVITAQKVLPVLSQVLYIAAAHEQSYTVTGLEPYRIYSFTITLCNRVGCISSEQGMGQTLAAGDKNIVCSAFQQMLLENVEGNRSP
ncbi:hypothetical protein lerEdw1_018906 [Lerista edwardsae]|nr:hypothetical protein lerEdw1_018906 [Lerista edwardsae]